MICMIYDMILYDMIWRYSSTLSYSWHYTQVNGQLHALASVPMGKKPSVPIKYKARCAPSQLAC